MKARSAIKVRFMYSFKLIIDYFGAAEEDCKCKYRDFLNYQKLKNYFKQTHPPALKSTALYYKDIQARGEY
jgi:hypothetical protein